jgi:origin recognition complex subunit 1
MAPMRKQAQSRSRVERAKQYLKGGGIARDDSDDELGIVDHPWEWIHGDQASSKNSTGNGQTSAAKRRAAKTDVNDAQDGQPGIIGARMGSFTCKIGDAVLLKADGNEAWVGIICDFLEDEEEGEKMANFMWFSTPREIRNKLKRRTDALDAS